MPSYDHVRLFRISLLDSIKIILFMSIIHTATSTTCYRPDKTIATDIPCRNGTVSACCSTDSYCLSNGYCMTNLMLSRHSCTDKSWASSECPQQCQRTNPGGDAQLALCYPDKWSCDPSSCLTSNFSLPKGSILSNNDHSGLTVTISAITTATTFNTPVTEITTIATFTTTITPITLATDVTSPSAPTGQVSQLKSITKTVVTGICIGIPFTMTIIALSLLLLLERQKSRSLTMEKSRLKVCVLYHKELYAQSLKVPRVYDGDESPRVR